MDASLWALLPLGMLAAIAPCPLATNVATIGYIAQNVDSKAKSACAALLYTLGRMVAYAVIALLISRGLASAPLLSYWLQEKLPVYLGPVMMVVGLVILEVIPFFSLGKNPSEGISRRLMSSFGVWGSFVLGLLFALALCPPSAALFFGTALPVALQSGSEGVLLGISLFGLGSALPVVVFSLLLIFSMEWASRLMNSMPKIQRVIKVMTGWFFLILGTYWLITKILIV